MFKKQTTKHSKNKKTKTKTKKQTKQNKLASHFHFESCKIIKITRSKAQLPFFFPDKKPRPSQLLNAVIMNHLEIFRKKT